MRETVSPETTTWRVPVDDGAGVGAGAACAAAGAPAGDGMRSTWPIRISARELSPLAAMIAWTVVPVRRAIALTVSPATTT